MDNNPLTSWVKLSLIWHLVMCGFCRLALFLAQLMVWLSYPINTKSGLVPSTTGQALLSDVLAHDCCSCCTTILSICPCCVRVQFRAFVQIILPTTVSWVTCALSRTPTVTHTHFQCPKTGQNTLTETNDDIVNTDYDASGWHQRKSIKVYATKRRSLWFKG